MPDDSPTPGPAPRQFRDYIRIGLVAMALLGAAALVSSVTQGLSARGSARDRAALAQQLDDARTQVGRLQDQLDCRYVIGADVSRIQSDIFVTTALALSAASRREPAAVRLYTARLDQLAADLSEASDLRADAVAICDTEPENVLG